MQDNNHILVITTGGTIGAMPYHEFHYSKDFLSTMPPAGKDFVSDALLSMPNSENIRCVSHDPRDSKLMDEPYRRQLLSIVEAASEQRVLITHGTDTLLQTADYFFEQITTKLNLNNRTIILTGSMIPLVNGPESDGYLNLNFALDALGHCGLHGVNPGVYIVLCDYESPDDESSSWQPHLYPYAPGRYQKIYCDDRRYSRLRKA